MAIAKLKTVTAAAEDDEQRIQKPSEPEAPSKPQKPSKPAEPSKPQEPSKPSKPATAASFDDFISVPPVATQELQEDSVEQAMVTLLQAYKELVPAPTSEQVGHLAGALGVAPGDLVLVLPFASEEPTPSGSLNEPGTAGNSFEGDALNPIGETDLDPIEKPMLTSATKHNPESSHVPGEEDEEEDEGFLLPMSSMEDPEYQYKAKSSTQVKSDATPKNNRTGVDDGAPVVDGDDDEQDVLIQDGVADTNEEDTDINNRSLNNDGLT